MAAERISPAGVVPILDAEVGRNERGAGGRSFRAILEEVGRPRATGPPGVSATGPEGPGVVRAMAQRALTQEREMDALLAAAASGRTFSATELLGLQVKVFRYSQAVEILSRATDRVVGAVRQALGTQV